MFFNRTRKTLQNTVSDLIATYDRKVKNAEFDYVSSVTISAEEYNLLMAIVDTAYDMAADA